MKHTHSQSIAPLSGAAERYAATVKSLDTKLLRHFLAVVEHKGFTTAAESLHITQPALTKSVQSLEHRLGVKLLERHRSAIIPTHYGEVLASHAKLIELQLAHTVSEIRSLKEGYMGTVNVGVGSTYAICLPHAILELQRAWPKLRVRVTVDGMEPLVAGLLAGDLDIICTAIEFPAYPDIEIEPLLDVENMLLARADHPLAGVDEPQAQQLLDYPWVAFSKSHMGLSRIGSYFAARQLEAPNLAVAVTSIDIMFSMLRQSNYIAAVPSSLRTNARTMGLTELALKDSFWRIRTGIAYRRASRTVPAVAAMADILRKTLVSPLPE